ncbi:RHS repeat-associated core domain-containing protein [Streptomyces sp. NPDC055036]
MGYTIPEGVDTMLDVVGVGWPNVDEDAYRDMADALREFADDADDDGHTAHGHIQRLLSTGQSESLTALDTHWKQVQGKNKDLAGAARLIAGALDRVADIIVARKIAAVAELADLCATVGITLAFAPVTAGLSTLLAGAKIAATRIAFKRILKEMAEAAVSEITAILMQPAVAALESIVTDLAIQTAMNVTGQQDGINAGQAVQAGKDGLQLNSAGGGTGPGGGLGIDHDAHGNTGGKLANVQVSMNTRAAGKIGKAKGHHGRAKGKDSLTAVLDSTIEGVVEKLAKGHNHIGKHVGKELPDAIGLSSKNHRNTDLDIDDRIKAVRSGDRRDDGGPDGQKGSEGSARRPADGSGSARKPAAVLNSDSSKLSQQARALADKELCGDPIDMASGQMVLDQTDVDLPGVLPLVLRRTHLSGYRAGRSFGPSWACTLDERLEQDEALGGFWWYREDGSALAYARLPDVPGDRVAPAAGARIPLTYVTRGRSYVLTVEDFRTGLVRHFEAAASREGLWWLVCVEDRNGNTVTVERDEDDVPLTVSHSGGYRVHVDSDAERGCVTGLSAALEESTVRLRTFGYDETGNMAWVRNADDATTHFSYADAHRITGWRDSNGTEFTYAYDVAGRVVATQGTDGILNSRIVYGTQESDGTSTVTYTDSLGHSTLYQSNRHGQITAITDPLGHTTTQRWDSCDNLLSRADPLGRTTRWDWDENGNLLSVTAPDDATVRVTYNHLHLPVQLIRQDASTVRQEFDTRGNLTRSVGADGQAHTFTHHPTGAVATATDPLGATTVFTADAAGLPVAVTDPLGATSHCVRDTFGRPTAITDALGHSTTTSWDAEGRRLRHTTPDGLAESWEWDGEGNCVRHTDPHGGTTRFTYGPFDLLSSRTTPDGATERFTYDTEMRPTRVTNPQSLSWNYTYDPLGRPVSETDFDGRTTLHTYDPAGQPSTRTTPAGDTIAFGFDAAGRLISRTSGETQTRFRYDTLSRLSSATSPDGSLENAYDPAGRLVAQTVDGATLRIAYDAAGRRISRTTPTGATTASEWNATGHRTSLTVDARHTLRFTHDAAGRETHRTFGAGILLTSAWDTTGRQVQQTLTRHPSPGPPADRPRPLRHRDYTYRPDHYLTAVTDRATGSAAHYTLDAVGRPLKANGPAGTERYAYDQAGNQQDARWPDRSADTAARGPRDYAGTLLTRAGDTHYHYDAAGRLVERIKKRLSRRPDVWRYSWDAEDRLTSCITPDGMAWHYRYDPLGRRTAKYRRDETGSITDETLFTWDGTRLAEQTTTATGTALTWDHEGYEPLTQLERKLSREETDSRFFAIVTDLAGTPTELVDEASTIAWHTRTTVWGTTAVHPGSTAHTPLRFPGQYADPETGLHYNYFRHYDPETARYTSPDPLGLEPAPNPVTYVHNPHTWIDPEGLKPGTCPRTGAAINPRGYTAIYEMQLNRADFGQSRAVHFNRANAALDAAIQADPALGRFLDQFSPGIAARVSSVGGRRTPAGFTWQHEPRSNAQGREGVMTLVPRYQHTSGSPWWDILHPGYSGGYAEWAIPNGAPPNRRA